MGYTIQRGLRKPKRSHGNLLVTSIILVVILGGSAPYLLFQETNAAPVAPDFQVTLQKGVAANDQSTWSNLTSTETILNGTSGLDNSGLKIIVATVSLGSFNGSIFLRVFGLPLGITSAFQPTVLSPVANGTAASSLTLTAAANVTSQLASYEVTVMATSSSPAITHSVSFSLRVRSTKLFWTPSTLSVRRGQRFTLNLALSDVSNVTGFQFTAHFNSTLLTALTNGTSFNQDFINFGYIVPPAFCPWVDNSTGTIGRCGLGATFIGQCTNAPCITVTGSETYTLLTQTFVANTNYNGASPVTLNNDIIVEQIGQNLFPDPHHSLGGIVTIGTDKPPIANFTSEPQPVQTGHSVFFNGSASMDPDGFITNYSWNFGDGTLGFGESPSHVYSNPGNYTVTLTVTDNSGLTGTTSQSVYVLQPLAHDVGIVSINPEPKTAVSGQTIDVGVGLTNSGQQAETVDLTVYYDSHVAVTVHRITVPVTSGGTIVVGNLTTIPQQEFSYFVLVLWDTSGVAAGNYTISATVFLAADQNPANNNLTDGQVTILPPPVLTLMPASGSLGNRVLVHGSGFPVSSFPGPFPSSVTVEVTFDDQFLGVTTTRDGTFDFVFDVPHAQVGSHEIHAIAEEFPSPIEATANFTVLPEPQTGGLAASISIGAVYFPGDTATMYVLATLNGSPTQPATIHLTIVFPNGTSSNISLQPLTLGLFEGSYRVPAKGSIGTYALVVSIQQNSLSASGLSSFEVKSSWLQTNGHTILMGTGVVAAMGVLGVLAMAWRGSYLTRRRRDNEP